jgi:polar amino acid transport system substrate-binding protein
MKGCRPYFWAACVGIVLALVLSGCANKDIKAESSAMSTSPSPAQPMMDQPALRVGISPHYPPIAFKEQGQLTGLEVDFARALGAELGRRVELVELDWEALLPALESGEIDVIMSGMSITEARARRVRFVSSYLRVGQMAIIRKADRLQLGSPTLLTMTDRRVGFVAGTTGADYVQENLPKAQYVPLGSTDEALQALREGEIDAFVHDAVTAWRVGDNEANDTLTSSFSPLTEEYLAWAVRRDDDALYRDLEAVLKQWKGSGRLQELTNQWLRFRAG